jgi:uncharacterized protein YjbI with pentapeptide repeats
VPSFEAHELAPPASIDAMVVEQGDVLAPPTGEADVRPPTRQSELVPILDETKLMAASFPWQLRPPRDARVVIVKATYDLRDGEVKLADEQDPPTGDRHHDDDPDASLVYPSDFVPFKPRTDVMLVGHALAGGEGNVGVVSFRFGPLRRRLAVFGDRSWGVTGASKPARFDRIALRWENALGGPRSDENPVGMGFKTGVRAPNLENPDDLLHSESSVSSPACLAPIAPSWRARRSKLGTYDARWLAERWPWLPKDLDWGYFNAAPPSQQLPYPDGDETFEITGVAADGPIAGRLPKARPRAYAQKTRAAGGEFVEVLLRLDTVWFDTDARKLVLVWRGMLETNDDDASEVATLFVTLDEQGSLDAAEAHQRMHREIARRELEREPDAQRQDAVNEAPDASLAAIYAKLAQQLDRAEEERRKVAEAPVPEAPPPEAPPPAAPRVERAEVLAWLEGGESLALRDLSGVDLSGLDLHGIDATGAILAGANLADARLDGAILAQANLAQANLERASLVDADLCGADLSSARLASANLAGARLDDTNFEGAHCVDVKLERAAGERTSFVGASLVGATLFGAKLRAADFSRALLEGARFVRADLTDARFYECDGMQVDFSEAILQNARCDDAKLPQANLRAVVAAGSNWNGADVGEANFEGAKLSGAGFERARLVGCNFNKADVTAGRFRKAQLRDARMLKANLMRAGFERADLSGADLRGANLYQANTWRATISRTRLELAILDGSNLAP